MANYTLTTSPQEVGRNTTPTVGARLLAWYTNAGTTSAMVHLKLQAISQGVTYTGTNKNYELSLDGTATGVVAWSYEPLTADTWIDVREITQYVNYGAAASVSGKVWTYVYGDAWITGNTVTIPNPYSPPTGLAISNLTPGTESFSADVSITSWGTGSGSKNLELQCWTLGMNQPRRYQSFNTNNLSANITVDNNSGYSPDYGPLTIVGNTEYTIGAYATNGSANTGSVNMGNSTTLAYNPTISAIIYNGSNVTVDYTTLADGGKYSKTYEYSIDGGTTWTTFATVAGGSASSGSFTITGLIPGTAYTMKTRVTTTAGTNNAPDVTILIPAENKLYGSVSSAAERITDLYGSANSQAQIITKFYGSDNGSATLVYQGFKRLYHRLLTSMTYTLAHIDQDANYHLISTVDDQKFISKYNSWAQVNNRQLNDLESFTAGYRRSNTSNPWTYYVAIMTDNVTTTTTFSSRSEFVDELTRWGITPGGSWYSQASFSVANNSVMTITPTYSQQF